MPSRRLRRLWATRPRTNTEHMPGTWWPTPRRLPKSSWPAVASGVRIGTPAITTIGMNTSHMRSVADFIADVLAAPDDETRVKKVREKVRDFMAQFEIP